MRTNNPRVESQFFELMESSLAHNYPNTLKIGPFNGTFFKRWQESIYSTIDVLNLGHILKYLRLKSDYENFSKWENGNKQVKHVILSTLRNELFDVYCQYKLPKDI